MTEPPLAAPARRSWPATLRGAFVGRGEVVALALLAVGWLALVAPLVLGQRTLYWRDVFAPHLSLASFGAAELAAGRVPAINPTWALGQGFRGNPNALAFYPDRLLFLALPFWIAFNLHYVGHWLLAFLTAQALARELGQSRSAARLSALTYAGSGYFFSALTFANLVVVVAWWPLALLGAHRGGRRGLAIGGLAVGLALLGGEPVTAALGAVPLAAVAIAAAGWRRGAGRTLAILALGALVALPQVVATARLLPFTDRGARGVGLDVAGGFYLKPLRLAELLVPFPFGVPGEIGPLDLWLPLTASPRLALKPYFLTLYVGVPALLLAARALHRRRLWAVLAGAGLAGAWLGRAATPLLVGASGGLFRAPEKLVFWFALAAALLVGFGLDAARDAAPRSARGARLLGAAAAVAAVLLALGRAPAATGLVRRAGIAPEHAVVACNLLIVELALAALLALATARALSTWRVGWLLALQALGLAQLVPLLRTDAVVPYAQPAAWRSLLPQPAAVVSVPWQFPPWAATPVDAWPAGAAWAPARRAAEDLHYSPGIRAGLTYPAAPDIDGMMSPLSHLLLDALSVQSPAARARWLRLLGTDAVVSPNAIDSPDLELVATRESGGAARWLYRVRAPAPLAWWPERLVPARDPDAALAALAASADPLAEVAVASPVAHRAGGRVRVLRDEPDRMAFEVESAGGLLVVRRAFQPLYEARAGASVLRTQPVQVALLGVEVPPGRQTVTLEVSARPERLAAALAAVVALVLLVVVVRR